MNNDKRYLKVFANQEEFESQKDSILEQPYVVLLEDTKKMIFSVEPYNPNDYEYVDLDLPSGIKWAKLNVGATKESDLGLFFQWGDTQGYTLDQCTSGKKPFSVKDYKWYNGGDSDSIIKYNAIDGKTVLDLEDDGCHVYMGGDWRLPTGTNMQELIDNTNYEYVTIEGIGGAKFTNKTDSSKYIFMPIGHCGNCFFGIGTGTVGWSSSINIHNNSSATCMVGNGYFGYDASVKSDWRYYGLPLRGVIDDKVNNTNTTVEVDETSINLLSNVEVTEDSITLLGDNIKIDSDENNNYNIIIE